MRLKKAMKEKSDTPNVATIQPFGEIKNNFCFLLFDLYFYRLQKS